MSEKEEIRFMKARLLRLASEEWNMTVEQVVDLFDQHEVLPYIAEFFGIFHVEGDYAVLEDIREYLAKRGVTVDG